MPSRRNLVRDIRLLTRVARGGLVRLDDAAPKLGLTSREATRRMRRLVRAGAVRRVARGLFLLIPPNTRNAAAERPRHGGVLAQALLHRCYIGGWSAAGHWSFPAPWKRETLIVTSSRIRSTYVRMAGERLRLVHVEPSLFNAPGVEVSPFGRFRVSGPERTLVDGLRVPWWLGGVRHLAAGLKAYRFSKLYDPDRFFDVLDLASNGAAIKRLGVLAELLRLPMGDILGTLGGRRTKGIVELEPGAGTAGPIDAYWGVRINVDLDPPEDEDDPYDDEELEDLELM